MSRIPKKWKVFNWSQYNKGLTNRGNLTILIDWESLGGVWYAENTKKNGSPFMYSDEAIEICLTIGALFNLPLRQTQGCVESLFSMMGLPYDIPDYTTLGKRGQRLQVTIKTQKKDVVALVVDSTGLKLYGEGEWKVRKHGYSKRRAWKKFHVGIDTDGEIRTVSVTDNNVHDCTQTENLFCPEMTAFIADGAYDNKNTYKMLEDLGITDVRIPPRRNAEIWDGPSLRNQHVARIGHTSREKWKQEIDYHERSHVEVTMFRYKNSFGDRLKARKDSTQETEITVRCNLLNHFKEIGWAEYVVT